MRLAILVGTKTVRAATPVVFGEAGVIGRRLFDDGCAITEKTLVRLGDDCSSTPASSCRRTRWRTA